jgi:uncharacterized protein YllA (UPF0747 family)
MMYQLTRLEGRAAAAEARKNAEIARHAEQISNALFPHKNLQEREFAGIVFIAKYGTTLLQQIFDRTELNCPDHQVLYL